MHVTRIAEHSALNELRACWNALAGGNPFRSYEWMTRWSRTLGGAGELFVLKVEDSRNEICGIAPLTLETTKSGASVLRLLGSGKACSDYVGILCDESQTELTTKAITNYLAQNGQWDFIELQAVPADDVAVSQLAAHLSVAGHVVHQQPAEACWRIELPDTWGAYLAMLSKSHRKQLRRVDRKYLQTNAATIHRATSANIEHAMEVFVELHQRRRRQLGDPGVFRAAGFREFLTLVAADLIPENRAAIYWVEIEGRPATAEFHLLEGGVQYAYQAGIEPDLLGHEPGRIIQIALIRGAIEQGYSGYDLLRGSEAYKAHWRATPRETTDWRIVANTTGAQVRDKIWQAGAAMKSWIKTGLHITGLRK